MTTATKEPKAPTAHSYSRMQMYSQCPMSYKLATIDKVPQDSSDALEIGAAAHEFFDRWVKITSGRTDLIGKVANEEDVSKLAATCFQQEARDQANFKDFLEICQTFSKEYRPDPKYPDVLSELPWAFNERWEPCGWNYEKVKFRMKVDLLEEDRKQTEHKKIRITDFKTGFAGQVDTFQLDCYALGASLVYPGLEQVEIVFYYVKSGFKQVKLLDVKDLDITKIQIESLIERMEGEKKWKAKPGARCLTCPVAASCSEKPSNMVKIDTQDVAVTLAAEIAFLEAQAKAKKKGLKAWCEQKGPVESGGLTWNNWSKSSMKVEIAPLLSTCVTYQVDPGDLLNPDSRAMKKAMKETPGFGEALSPYVSMETTTYFGAKKSDSDE